LAAAVWLTITVPACEPVAYWCLTFRLALGSLLASTFLFFIPLALLATTGPFLVRVITSSLASVGTNVGRLTSISTLGSLAGTLLIGYFLIPLLPNSWTMLLTAAILALLAVVHFAWFRRRSLLPALALTALGAIPAFGVALGPRHSLHLMQERYSANSHFGMLQVLDRADGSCRFYLNDNLVQNTYDPIRKQSVSHFTYMLSGLAKAFTTNINDVLCIGLGVGIVPMEFARDGVRVDVVEINPSVVKLGQMFFDLEPQKMNLTIGDGASFECDVENLRCGYPGCVSGRFLPVPLVHLRSLLLNSAGAQARWHSGHQLVRTPRTGQRFFYGFVA
jgi:predicted membrane-bound spermidine synthase